MKIVIEIDKMTPQDRRHLSLYDSIAKNDWVSRGPLAIKHMQKRRVRNRIAKLSRRRNR